ncbi:sulfatase-like hydrolase/transferase [Alteromonas sp. A081]|uniref:sulfatase-like hydrolase/transferase n=1 Tax=Alteromonas sp. A081 TaxID=3410269 RepID=UPI003B982CE3
MTYMMNKNKLLRLLTSVSLLICVSGCGQISPKESQPTSIHNIKAPNILFIYTDDQAPWALGRSGNKQALTPNLDKLAKQGMYLPNAYSTTPVCTPSRAGLLTSQYGYELGLDDWINTKAKTLTGHQPDLGIEQKYETWPEVLQQAGYTTGLIGKWHLGYKTEHHPKHHGYDEFVGFVGGGTTPENPFLEINGVNQKTKGLTTDILTDHALMFLEKHKDKRFALSLHYRAPHYAFLPVAPEDEAPYLNMDMKLPHPDYPDLNTKRAKKLMREYLSSVRGIDRNVGRVLAALDQLDLTDNTLVVFTSDHGYNIAFNGMWHKGNGFWLLNNKTKATENIPSGQRPNLYDPSLKVPTIVRWPNVIKANSENRSTISNLDWFPTLVGIAQAKASSANIIRGKDFFPALLDENIILSTDYYAAYTTQHQSITGMRMYSDGQFKLLRDFKNKGRDEFYDLKNDPDETTNLLLTGLTGLTAEQQSIVTKFEGIMLNKMRTTADPLLPLAIK